MSSYFLYSFLYVSYKLIYVRFLSKNNENGLVLRLFFNISSDCL